MLEFFYAYSWSLTEAVVTEAHSGNASKHQRVWQSEREPKTHVPLPDYSGN